MIQRQLPVVLLFILLTGCATRGTTGFITPDEDISPVAFSYTKDRPVIRISDAQQATVIIYQHGTKRPSYRENCKARIEEIPVSITALEEEPGTYIWFICSTATDDGTRGSYIFKRVAETDVVLDELLAAGVKPRNLFLAGHSAGGWVSLMAAQEIGAKFNAAIAFAPACCGSREEINRFPLWRKKTRPAQVKQMLSADRLRALVFAYSDDAFNRPDELQFLMAQFPASTELVGYDCKAGHTTHLNDCRSKATTQRIHDYVLARKQDF